MGRRRNIAHWAGLVIVLAAPVLHLFVFVRIPSMRNLPWTPFLMLGAGLLLIGRGLRRAWREPDRYRGRIAAPLVAALGLMVAGFFGFALLYAPRQIPPATDAPRVGEKAPGFTLADQEGRPVSLEDLLRPGTGGGGAGNGGAARGVLLVFYRGHW
jgi:hypothetical protein